MNQLNSFWGYPILRHTHSLLSFAFRKWSVVRTNLNRSGFYGPAMHEVPVMELSWAVLPSQSPWRQGTWLKCNSCRGEGVVRTIVDWRFVFFGFKITKGSVSYLSSPCFSTIIGGIGGPARAIHGILAVMYWISIIRGGAPPPL